METSEKRSKSEKIRRRFTALLAPLGFQRTKSTFWTRRNQYTVDFVHLHLYTFAPAFRAHCGIRVLNDSFPASGLNGPDANSASGIRFEFSDSEESVVSCATDIANFIRDIGEPWFALWKPTHKLLDSTNSPLTQDAKDALETAINGKASAESIAQSEQILGLNR